MEPARVKLSAEFPPDSSPASKGSGWILRRGRDTVLNLSQLVSAQVVRDYVISLLISDLVTELFRFIRPLRSGNLSSTSA